jgi:glycosyltransferase involved in cell wall biosynthesis
MPRVVRIINRLNLGGPTYNAVYLTKYLAPEFETILVAGVKQESEESSEFILKTLGVEPVIIPEMSRDISPFKDIASYDKINSIIKKYRPDIVHTHAAKAGALGRVSAMRNKVPVVVHTFHGHFFHSYFSSYKTKIFLKIEQYLARHCDAIIALSETQKKELSVDFPVCPPEKIRVIPLGFDLAKFSVGMDAKRKIFREKYHVSENEIAVGIIGRIVPVKNHTLFLNALKMVLEKTSVPVKAFIIGDGEDRNKIESVAASLNLAFSTPQKNNAGAKLIFTSWIKEIDTAIAGLDIIAMTSLNEGTPVSIIEAQAAGKPVVATAVGGIYDVVINGETALLSSTGNAQAFAENLLLLIENSIRRKNMQEKGREFVAHRFGYKRLVNDMSLLYKELLTQKTAPFTH